MSIKKEYICYGVAERRKSEIAREIMKLSTQNFFYRAKYLRDNDFIIIQLNTLYKEFEYLCSLFKNQEGS